MTCQGRAHRSAGQSREALQWRGGVLPKQVVAKRLRQKKMSDKPNSTRPQLPHPRKEVGHLLSVGSSAVWRRPSVGVPNTKINKQQNHNVGGQILGRILKMH
ncbi:Complement Component C1Q Receptor [Manis pentadactyla]|nr:Complement Component C1Q Receptor [Manis pentadactyla]